MDGTNTQNMMLRARPGLTDAMVEQVINTALRGERLRHRMLEDHAWFAWGNRFAICVEMEGDMITRLEMRAAWLNSETKEICWTRRMVAVQQGREEQGCHVAYAANEDVPGFERAGGIVKEVGTLAWAMWAAEQIAEHFATEAMREAPAHTEAMAS